MTEKISFNKEAEPKVNEVVSNIWGSWQNLYRHVQQSLREYQENGRKEEIDQKEFFQNLIGYDNLSAEEYALARKAVRVVLQQIKKRMQKIMQTADDFLRELAVEEAKEWQEEELKRSGGVDPNEI